MNETIKNPNLINAMHNLIENETEETQNAMIHEMMVAQYISPVIMKSPTIPTGTKKSEPNTNATVSFKIITNNEGERYFPVFTDWNELLKWIDDNDQPTLVTTLDDLAALILEPNHKYAGYVINPFSESITITYEMIEQIVKDQKKN